MSKLIAKLISKPSCDLTEEDARTNAQTMLDSLPDNYRQWFDIDVWHNLHWCYAIRSKHLGISVHHCRYSKADRGDQYTGFLSLDGHASGHSSILGDVPCADTAEVAIDKAIEQLDTLVKDYQGKLTHIMDSLYPTPD